MYSNKIPEKIMELYQTRNVEKSSRVEAVEVIVSKSGMENIQFEILLQILHYAIPILVTNKTKRMRYRKEKKSQDSEKMNFLAWTLNLRKINKHWKCIIDKNDKLWFVVTDLLMLHPPEYLYSGGTYLDVCRLLVKAQKQRAIAYKEMEERNRSMPRMACGISFWSDVPKTYPNPRENSVKIPAALLERIADNTKALESFLRSVDFAAGSDKEQWAESALIRYRMFLHLKKMYPNLWLLPTVDIEFCWLAHIFRTEKYWKDTKDLGIKPDHKLYLEGYGEVVAWSEALQGTAILWQKEFGCSYLDASADTSWNVWKVVGGGFDLCKVERVDPRRFFPQMGPKVESVPNHVTLPAINISKDEICADLTWYSEFKEGFKKLRSQSYQITGSSSWDFFLKHHLIPSYERYLNLVSSFADSSDSYSPGPPVILDLVWHAHQTEPVRYKNECLSLFGREFLHDPWPNGLGVMTEASDKLQCAWKTVFGTTIDDDWTHISPNNEQMQAQYQ